MILTLSSPRGARDFRLLDFLASVVKMENRVSPVEFAISER